MALEFATSFELNTVTNLLESINASFYNGTGNTSVTSHVKTGTYALDFILNSTGNQYLYSPLSSSKSHYQKVSLYIVTLPDVESYVMEFGSSNGVYEGSITLSSDGTLRLYYSDVGGGQTQIGSASAALSTGQFYDVELHADDIAGIALTTYEARLNSSVFASSTVATFASSTGIEGGNAALDCYAKSGTPTQGEWIFDDWIVNDIVTGGSVTGYVGNCKVYCQIPNAAGDVNTFATQTGGTAGAGNNFTRVDEVTPDDATSFNGSSTLNQEDLYNTSDPGIGGSDTVLAVQVMARYRNSTADTKSAIKLEIEKTASGTILQGATILPNSTTWKTTTPALSIIAYTDPDGGAWTETTLATMQMGMKDTAAPNTAGRRVDITKIWAYVLVQPAASGTQYYSSLATLGCG